MASAAGRIINVTSLVGLGVSALLLFASFHLDPWHHRISITDQFHVGVWARGIDARIVFFNNADYGPYRGSILYIGTKDTPSPFEREIRFGDAWGIYLRYFRWPDQTTLWTLMVSLWYPLAIFSVWPLLSLPRRLRAGKPAG